MSGWLDRISHPLVIRAARWVVGLLFAAAALAKLGDLGSFAEQIHNFRLLPWGLANLSAILPGVKTPTAHIETPAALAVLVFLSTHFFGIKSRGLTAYLRHYTQPSILLMPLNVLSEVTRTFSLMIRLFGNMMSLEMAALLILLVAGFLAPVPILMLHIVEAAVQAYIFGMLALIYVAGGIQSQQLRQQKME